MAISPMIQREINRQITQIQKRLAAPSGPAWAARYIGAHGLNIEALATADEPPEPLRARLKEAYVAYAPTTPGDVALVEQLVASTLEAQRCRRLQARLRTERRRTAELRWEREQEDEILRLWSLGSARAYEILTGLKRTAAGCRWVAARWRRLAAALEADGTWYGSHKHEAIMLQGYSSMVEDLRLNEEAYMTWVHCLATQPDPDERDVALILDEQVMPLSIQQRGLTVWRPNPAESRAYLAAIVARELPAIEALEAQLRVAYEEPARAAARELDEIATRKQEAPLLRELRSHERAVQLVHQALMRRKAGRA